MQLRKALEPGDKFRVFWEKGAADSPNDMADYNDHWMEVIFTSSNKWCERVGCGRSYVAVWKKDNNPGKMKPRTMDDEESRTRFFWYEWNMVAVRYKNEPFPPENITITKEMLPYI